jgi:ATP-dependent protease HslVU (ClpYQ) ATPase subunit
VGGSRRELRNQDRRNDLYKLVKGRTGRRQGVTYKEDTVNQIANDLRPATTSLVNEQQTAELSNNSENRADALILESIVGGNTNLLENRSTKVLNSTDTRHLASGLDRARQEKATEA